MRRSPPMRVYCTRPLLTTFAVSQVVRPRPASLFRQSTWSRFRHFGDAGTRLARQRGAWVGGGRPGKESMDGASACAG